MKIGDVEIDQNFFMQDEVLHSVIFGKPFIMASPMETKVLDNGVAFARIRSQSGGIYVQFITMSSNHERNKRVLLSQTEMDQSGYTTQEENSRNETSADQSRWGIYIHGRNRSNEERISKEVG